MLSSASFMLIEKEQKKNKNLSPSQPNQQLRTQILSIKTHVWAPELWSSCQRFADRRSSMQSTRTNTIAPPPPPTILPSSTTDLPPSTSSISTLPHRRSANQEHENPKNSTQPNKKMKNQMNLLSRERVDLPLRQWSQWFQWEDLENRKEERRRWDGRFR